jgi:membrane-bound lytic murein transglycosylase D
VPKLQAVKNIVANPARYRTQLPDIGNHPFFDTVALQRDMDVALIAQLADISEKDFRQLNPAVNKPVILAGGGTTILLPWDNATLFEQRLAQHSGPLASWTVWTVPNRMSVSQIASQLGVEESELRELNKIPPRMQVKAGSALLVPRQGAQDQDVPSHVADHGQILLAKEAPPPRPAAPVQRSSVRVDKGDTLIGLAREHGISVSNLAQWNGLSTKASLKTGQTLQLRAPEKKNTASSKRSSGKSKKATNTQANSKDKTTRQTNNRRTSSSKKTQPPKNKGQQR